MTQKRTGETMTTSVSVTKPFMNLINKYHLSPTEVFRRGVAITLCELGITPYKNPLNEERLNNAKEFLEDMDKKQEALIRLTQCKKCYEELLKI